MKDNHSAENTSKAEGVYYYARLAGDAPFDTEARAIVEQVLLDNKDLILDLDPVKHKDRIVDVEKLLQRARKD